MKADDSGLLCSFFPKLFTQKPCILSQSPALNEEIFHKMLLYFFDLRNEERIFMGKIIWVTIEVHQLEIHRLFLMNDTDVSDVDPSVLVFSFSWMNSLIIHSSSLLSCYLSQDVL